MDPKVGGYNTIIEEKAKELSDRMRDATATLTECDDKIEKMKDKVASNEKDIDTAFANLFNKGKISQCSFNLYTWYEILICFENTWDKNAASCTFKE